MPFPNFSTLTILKRYFFYQTLIENNVSRYETTDVPPSPKSFKWFDICLLLLQKILKFMIPLSILAASKFSYSDTKLPYDHYMNKTAISKKLLVLYDNSLILSNSTYNQRINFDSDVLRWQVENYKNGSKPNKNPKDLFNQDQPPRFTTVKGHLVEVTLFSIETFNQYISYMKENW